VAEQLALIKGCPIEEIGRITSANFKRLFTRTGASTQTMPELE
jgi:Tat protein secretion system quality control protein TatD with DNase activity